MSSRQSCFKTIIKCDLKRSWWISALAALFIFMGTTSQLFNNRYDYYSYSGYHRYSSAANFCETMFLDYVIGMCAAAFVVLFLFSYLNKVNSVSFFHTLPAKRTTLLSAHLTSSIILIVLPMLVNTIISLFAVGRGIKASWVLLSFLVYLLYSFVVMAVTLVVSLLTGVSIASAIFTVVVGFLPLFIITFAAELCSAYLYGFNGSNALFEFLGKYVYLVPEYLLSWRMIIYIIGIAALLGFSYFLYNKRHLENYSEVIAFPNLKGTFKVLFGICSGVIGYYYFDAFWSIQSILTMLVFGTLGVIIAHMIAGRSLSLKGVLKPILINTAFVLVLFAAFFFDLFGFEKRIPDIDDIEYACIGNLYYEDYTYVESDIFGENRIRVTKKDPYIPYYRSEEDINLFLKLHQYAIDHQNENDVWDDDFITPSYRVTQRDSINIEYKLKNGKTMTRYYSLPIDEMRKLKYDIYNTDVYRMWKYPVIDGVKKIYKSVSVYNAATYVDGAGKFFAASSDEAKKIIEAIKKDRENISYERIQLKNHDTLISINLDYSVTYISEKGVEYQVDQSDSYNIDKNDVNTWALLSELGLFDNDRMIELSDVTSATVNVEDYYVNADENNYIYEEYYDGYDYTYEKVTVEYANKYYKDGTNYREFTERADVEDLFNMFMNHVNEPIPDDEDYLVLLLRLRLSEETARARTIVVRYSDLPEALSYLK